MSEVKIVCPQCGGKFTLRAANLQMMASKTFRCPKCGFSSSFGQLMGNAGMSPQTLRAPQQPLHTHIATGPATPGGKTSISTHNNIARLEVIDTGHEIPLSQGIYTLGRQSSDSRASLQIAPDRFMSRLQAKLQVASINGTPLCQITGVSATNPIFVNNSRVSEGQVVKLRNGDVILLGMTKVKIKF